MLLNFVVQLLTAGLIIAEHVILHYRYFCRFLRDVFRSLSMLDGPFQE
jgi:hypothetical protein